MNYKRAQTALFLLKSEPLIIRMLRLRLRAYKEYIRGLGSLEEVYFDNVLKEQRELRQNVKLDHECLQSDN